MVFETCTVFRFLLLCPLYSVVMPYGFMLLPTVMLFSHRHSTVLSQLLCLKRCPLYFVTCDVTEGFHYDRQTVGVPNNCIQSHCI